jgi:hypothetical protein
MVAKRYFTIILQHSDLNVRILGRYHVLQQTPLKERKSGESVSSLRKQMTKVTCHYYIYIHL